MPSSTCGACDVAVLGALFVSLVMAWRATPVPGVGRNGQNPGRRAHASATKGVRSHKAKGVERDEAAMNVTSHRLSYDIASHAITLTAEELMFMDACDITDAQEGDTPAAPRATAAPAAPVKIVNIKRNKATQTTVTAVPVTAARVAARAFACPEEVTPSALARLLALAPCSSFTAVVSRLANVRGCCVVTLVEAAPKPRIITILVDMGSAVVEVPRRFAAGAACAGSMAAEPGLVCYLTTRFLCMRRAAAAYAACGLAGSSSSAATAAPTCYITRGASGFEALLTAAAATPLQLRLWSSSSRLSGVGSLRRLSSGSGSWGSMRSTSSSGSSLLMTSSSSCSSCTFDNASVDTTPRTSAAGDFFGVNLRCSSGGSTPRASSAGDINSPLAAAAAIASARQGLRSPGALRRARDSVTSCCSPGGSAGGAAAAGSLNSAPEALSFAAKLAMFQHKAAASVPCAPGTSSFGGGASAAARMPSWVGELRPMACPLTRRHTAGGC